MKIFKGDKAKARTQQYIKLNTRAKDIQLMNLRWPDNRQSIRPQQSHLYIHIRWNHNRVLSLTRQRATKEEGKVTYQITCKENEM